MLKRKLILKLMRRQFEIAGFPKQEGPIPWKQRVQEGPHEVEFEAVLDMCCTIRCLKLREYGTGHLDPANWATPLMGISSHMHDLHRKWARLENMVWSKNMAHGVQLFDTEGDIDTYHLAIETLADMVNYGAQFIQILWRLYSLRVLGVDIGTATEEAEAGQQVEVITHHEHPPQVHSYPKIDPERGMVISTSTSSLTYQWRTKCQYCMRDFSFSGCVVLDATRIECPHCGQWYTLPSEGSWKPEKRTPWPTGVGAPPSVLKPDWLADAVEGEDEPEV